MDRPRVVNYARMKRISDAMAPEPTGWEMTNSTKFCMALLFIGALVLYSRWVNKNKRTVRVF